MNFNENRRNEWKIAEKSTGCTSKITHISVVKCPIEPKIVSEYDQEIPQIQTADNPVAPRGRAAQPSRDTRKTN